ncbi:hypothetical protein [Candidatus Electronema sp. PJ]|uniref:hypothetical protein n=1 Tax=Candidatus Electronema sp. PJ TaxID=3401572 RepID=UPI003AA83CFB
MKASRIVLAAVSLLLLVAAAQDVFAQRVWRAKEEVEAGGWYVAYGRELTEDEAERGAVESWVSLQRSDIDTLRTWSDSLLRQSIALMVNSVGPDAADRFGRDEQREARRFGVETLRDLLGSRTAGAQILVSGSVEFKAGVIEYRERGWDHYDRRRRQVMFMPYFALRPKYSHRRHRDRDDGWRDRDRGDHWEHRDRWDHRP